MSTRDQMKRALQEVVVPRLREMGFAGSLPSLRRVRPDRIELLEFQFDQHGGGFVIELGQCGPDGYMAGTSEHVPADKVAPYHLPMRQRARVQPRAGSGNDAWFRYDAAAGPEDYRKVAQSVLPFLEEAARVFDESRFLDECGSRVPRKPGLWAAAKRLVGRE